LPLKSRLQPNVVWVWTTNVPGSLRLTLRPEAKAARLLELVHRAVPYPLLLLAESAAVANISTVHKRWAQNEAGKTVLDGDLVAAEWEDGRSSGYWAAFREALALGRQPRSTLHALYQGWADTLLAFKAAQITGSYRRRIARNRPLPAMMPCGNAPG
jgi:hypothetical protein